MGVEDRARLDPAGRARLDLQLLGFAMHGLPGGISVEGSKVGVKVNRFTVSDFLAFISVLGKNFDFSILFVCISFLLHNK